MTTALQLIKGALQTIGVLQEGETPSGIQATDCLATLNMMLDSWSIERLSVYALQDQTFTWPSSTVSRTLGPSGQLAGTRPIQVDDATYFNVAGVSYNLTQINREQYDSIALKTANSPYPQWLYANPTMPDATLYLYPVPSQAIELHVISVQPLGELTLATVLSLPPGYLRALTFNLGCELAPQFGGTVTRKVERIADVSKRSLKRVNNPRDVMSMPVALIARNERFNIYTGQ